MGTRTSFRVITARPGFLKHARTASGPLRELGSRADRAMGPGRLGGRPEIMARMSESHLPSPAPISSIESAPGPGPGGGRGADQARPPQPATR